MMKRLWPAGRIEITLKSCIENVDGTDLKNEPKTISFGSMRQKEMDAIKNQDEYYVMLVNQLVNRFKKDMWYNQRGMTRITWEDIDRFEAFIYRIQNQVSEKDVELLNKILEVLGGARR